MKRQAEEGPTELKEQVDQIAKDEQANGENSVQVEGQAQAASNGAEEETKD